MKKINYEFSQKKNFYFVKEKFLSFSRKEWIIEVTNDEMGKVLEQGFVKEQELEEIFFKLKNQYDILYKDYEIEKYEKHNSWMILAFIILLVISIINLWTAFGGKT